MNMPVQERAQALPIEMLSDVAEQPETSLPAIQTAEVAGPLGAALQALKLGVSVADMKDMLALQKDWEANEARKAFAEDMATFKLNPPEILKESRVYYQGAKGIVDYDHASLGEVCDKIIAAAAAHGFSHRWKPTTPAVAGNIAITCVITHRKGHFEETTLEGARDDSGGKNTIQGVGSTGTFLSRYTILMAYGFATKAMPDDDGNGAGAGEGGATGYNAAENLRHWKKQADDATTPGQLVDVRRSANIDFVNAKDPAGWELFKVHFDARKAYMEEHGA